MLEQIPVARILFIDDDVDLVTLLSDYLSLDNMLVTPAYSGPEGIRKFEAGAFDLVILDVMMPEMNGIEVLKVLREKSHVPVLMLTATPSTASSGSNSARTTTFRSPARRGKSPRASRRSCAARRTPRTSRRTSTGRI